METTDIIGWLAAAIALVAYLPQTIKTIVTRKTRDLSLLTYLAVCTAAILWTLFGVGRNEASIWFTNTVIALCTIIIVFLTLVDRIKSRTRGPE